MLEWAASGILGSLLGGLFRLAPEIIKWLDRVNERKHELAMFKLQTDLEKVRGEFRMEERYVDHGIAQLGAINTAFEQQGKSDERAWKWVASISALVRPGIAWLIFGMYAVFKFTALAYAVQSGVPWITVVESSWTQDDFTVLMMILTFYYVGRPLERYGSGNIK